MDDGLYRIDELLWFSEDELKETYVLKHAEVKWLLREVNKVVAAENAEDCTDA